MGYKEDYLFWTLAKQLSDAYEYRMITLSDDQQEIWLENESEKEYPVIRLMRYDLDWGSWLKRDMDRTVLNAERIRKELYKSSLKVLNIYVSAFVPVDEYTSNLNQPTGNRKIEIRPLILETAHFAENKEKLDALLKKPLQLELSENETLDEDQVAYIKHSVISSNIQRAKQDQEVFLRSKPFFTYVFIGIQILMFLLLEMNGGSKNMNTLVEFGAKYSPNILQGEWWRFLSPIVLHIGVLHLLMNTLALYYLGADVERIYGNTRFLLIYLFAGFAGTLGSFLFSPNISAGASGAIFGCFGALLFFGLNHRKIFFKTIGMNIIVLIIINLAFGFSMEGIDNAGHIGGLIGGFLASGAVGLPGKKAFGRQFLFLAATAAVTYFLLQWGFSEQGAKPAANDQAIAAIASSYIKEGKEDKALEVLNESVENGQAGPETYFILGTVQLTKGNLPEAEAFLSKAVEQNPEFHQAHYQLAIVYINLQNASAAKEHASKAVQLQPDEKIYIELLDKMNEMR
ncbi:rhomboid family intramembrane serine protease [Bacillus sp. M6-12]|uniref:rhomboid family protein n=1 Tax=Bacillus sp. M6-12 TaxID=2054166 RepID=UPI000C792467|nr:rhomboid family intramembrane serine protease [Bacillus sp. M6-12]PLS15240.1 rhomboid family intramembrane serine protease [Bacillus sp. M6-12]